MTQAGARATRVSIAWVLGVLLVMAAWLAMVGLLAPPAPPAPLRIAIGPWIGYEPFVLARENDWLGPRSTLPVADRQDRAACVLLRLFRSRGHTHHGPAGRLSGFGVAGTGIGLRAMHGTRCVLVRSADK